MNRNLVNGGWSFIQKHLGKYSQGLNPKLLTYKFNNKKHNGYTLSSSFNEKILRIVLTNKLIKNHTRK
jgi:hypothetical protein